MGLNINTEKAKFMIVTREPGTLRNASLMLENIPIKRVYKYKYLGTYGCVKIGRQKLK